MRILNDLNNLVVASKKHTNKNKKNLDVFEAIFNNNKHKLQPKASKKALESVYSLSSERISNLINSKNKGADSEKTKVAINDILMSLMHQKNIKTENEIPNKVEPVLQHKNNKFHLNTDIKLSLFDIKQLINELELALNQKVSISDLVDTDLHPNLEVDNQISILKVAKGKENPNSNSVKQLHKEVGKEKDVVKEDIFEELKKLRKKESPVELKEQNVVLTNTNWQVASSKKTQMKIDDWIDSFKDEINKLTEFRIENKQKVSMILKEQEEELRIVVEKKGSLIVVEASVTDNMRDRLDHILAEVQNEMGEKGIEIKVDIKREDGQKQKNNQKEEQQERGDNKDDERN
ncbi:hypothetical protein [Bacillus toyonensis]|uniref:hypothetical protein n=1 Tax=Bacillus toyonensis TaxID=155322 RepID=UPI002E1D5DB4|nr:hypothetical protein [Bacillus toyonensis]